MNLEEYNWAIKEIHDQTVAKTYGVWQTYRNEKRSLNHEYYQKHRVLENKSRESLYKLDEEEEDRKKKLYDSIPKEFVSITQTWNDYAIPDYAVIEDTHRHFHYYKKDYFPQWVGNPEHRVYQDYSRMQKKVIVYAYVPEIFLIKAAVPKNEA